MSTGEKIRELRKERGWSQRELGERTGISKTLINRYEQDRAKPTAKGLENLARVLNVTVDYLLFGKTDDNTIGDRELFELFKQADNFSLKNRQLTKEILYAIAAKEKLQSAR